MGYLVISSALVCFIFVCFGFPPVGLLYISSLISSSSPSSSSEEIFSISSPYSSISFKGQSPNILLESSIFLKREIGGTHRVPFSGIFTLSFNSGRAYSKVSTKSSNPCNLAEA